MQPSSNSEKECKNPETPKCSLSEKKCRQKKTAVYSPDDNIVRKISNLIQPYIHPTLGVYYGAMHLTIMFFSGIILLFDNNVIHLIVLLIIVTLDAMACVFLHNCPLSILEKKYLGHSIVGTRMYLFQNLGICYNCGHEYEVTIEFLTNMASFIIGKLFILMVSQMFSVEFTLSVKNAPLL